MKVNDQMVMDTLERWRRICAIRLHDANGRIERYRNRPEMSMRLHDADKSARHYSKELAVLGEIYSRLFPEQVSTGTGYVIRERN